MSILGTLLVNSVEIIDELVIKNELSYIQGTLFVDGVIIDESLIVSSGIIEVNSLILSDSMLSSNSVTIHSSDLTLENYTLTLPTTSGISSQTLTTDGFGNLVWSASCGDVVGPVGSTDNAIVRFDGITGKLIKNSGIVLDDNSNFVGTNSISTNNLNISSGAIILKEPGININTITIQTPPTGSVTFILPATDGSSFKALSTDGSISDVAQLGWDSVPKISGADTQIQFNDQGSFAGNSNLTFDKSTETIQTLQVSIKESSNINTITLTVPELDSVDITLIFPVDVGTSSGQVLKTDGNNPANLYWENTGTGDVTGPLSSSADNLTSFKGITGKIIQNSGSSFSRVQINDANDILNVNNLSISGNTIVKKSIKLEEPGIGTNTIIIQSPTILSSGSQTLQLPGDTGILNQYFGNQGEWETDFSALVGGSIGQIQFKNGEIFEGSPRFTYDDGSSVVNLTGKETSVGNTALTTIQTTAITTWTSQEVPPSTPLGTYAGQDSLNSIAWSPELGLFVGAASNYFKTSSDGLIWIAPTSSQSGPTTDNWKSIIWVSELGLFVAVSNSIAGNQAITSPDGTNWTTRSVPVNYEWSSITWSPELGLIVAVPSTVTSNNSLYSRDGIEWFSSIIPSGEWKSVTWSPELSLFAAVGIPPGVFIQQGSKLLGTGYTGMFNQQGQAVSIYGDTMVVGGGDNGGIGAAWVFVRTGTTWSQQGTKLVGTGGIGAFQTQGSSVSIYGDTMVVGGYLDNNSIGATWVFTRTGTTWSQQGPKLVGTGNVGTPQQGSSVSIYEDTIVVGGRLDNGWIGAVWVFVRTGTTWLQQGTKLVGTGSVGQARQGYSVSIYEDTIIVSGNRDDSDIGAVWVFVRTGTTWSQQGTKLIGTGSVGTSGQGISVSIYEDTIIVGGPNDDTQTGAVWVFTRTGTMWSQQGAKLVGTGYTGAATQGRSVSIYGDTIVVGGNRDDSNIGAVWVFTRTGTTWSQQGTKLVGTGNVGASQQGGSLSIYEDTFVTGGSTDDVFTGASWVFNFTDASIMTSSNGITNWETQTQMTPVDNSWESVAWSPELGVFVAVSSTGTNDRVMTSSDGTLWEVRTTPVDNNWESVAWSPGLSTFVAVSSTGTGDRIMSSTNGTDWETHTNPVDINYVSIVWSPGLNIFAASATVSGAENEIMISNGDFSEYNESITAGLQPTTNVTMNVRQLDIGASANSVIIGNNPGTLEVKLGKTKIYGSLVFQGGSVPVKSINLNVPPVIQSYQLRLPKVQGVGLSTVLINDGTGTLIWDTIPFTSASLDTELIYNNSGISDGTGTIKYDDDSSTFTVESQSFFTGITTGVPGNSLGISVGGELVEPVSMRQYKRAEVPIDEEVGYNNEDAIMKLQPKFFTWKKTDERELGFIVEDVIEKSSDAFIFRNEFGMAKNIKDRSVIAGTLELLKQHQNDLNEMKKMLN
jgi:hypothetical protein